LRRLGGGPRLGPCVLTFVGCGSFQLQRSAERRFAWAAIGYNIYRIKELVIGGFLLSHHSNSNTKWGRRVKKKVFVDSRVAFVGQSHRPTTRAHAVSLIHLRAAGLKAKGTVQFGAPGTGLRQGAMAAGLEMAHRKTVPDVSGQRPGLTGEKKIIALVRRFGYPGTQTIPFQKSAQPPMAHVSGKTTGLPRTTWRKPTAHCGLTFVPLWSHRADTGGPRKNAAS